ncbi:MAG: MBL fold metallo-hydrolase [Gemmatimonadota bacterium]
MRKLPLALLFALSVPILLHAQGVGQGRTTYQGAELTFLDVGQGDAILIRSDTFVVLIDAGRNQLAVDDLRRLGVDHVNLLVASHNHFDHIGGMDAIIRALPVALFIDNGCQESSEAQAYVEDAMRERHLGSRAAWDTTFTLGPATLRILPSPFYTPACDSSQNNLSVGAILRVGHFSALLTGDSEKYEEIAWVNAGLIPDVDVLKAAHHGADNGVTPGWIATANPEVVVISVGTNTYGHPCPGALGYYQTHGRRVLRTDRDGTVTVRVDSSGAYQVQPQ